MFNKKIIIAALVFLTAMFCLNVGVKADEKFPSLSHSDDITDSKAVGDVFSSIGKDGNWRSTLTVEDGAFERENNKCIRVGFAGDGQSFYSLNSTLYLTAPDQNEYISDKMVTISFSMAVGSKNFQRAGLMIGSGLDQWVSTRVSAESENSDSVGIIGMTKDGIFSFGEKLMDYDSGKWYDFKVVIYGGTNKYDVYVDGNIVKARGTITSKFSDIARTALVGYSPSVASSDGAIDIYYDNIATSIEDMVTFPTFPNKSDFSNSIYVGDAFSLYSKDGNWRSQLDIVGGIFGKAQSDKSLCMSFVDGDGIYSLNSTLYLTDLEKDFDISDKNIKISFSIAVESKNFQKAGLMVGNGLGEWVSGISSVNCENSDARGIIGLLPSGIYAFGEKLAPFVVGTWYDFDVIIYGGTYMYDVYVNETLIKSKGSIDGKFSNIARTALIGYRESVPLEAGDIRIYYDDVSTSYFEGEDLAEVILLENGNEVSDLYETDSRVTISARASSADSDDSKYNFIIASYEGNKLTGIDIFKDYSYGDSVSLSLESVAPDTHVKCFKWTGVQTPLVKEIAFETRFIVSTN